MSLGASDTDGSGGSAIAATRFCMIECRRILVVAPNPAVGGRIAGWLSAEGHDVRICTSFIDAKPELDRRPPDLLITELKLGAANGLHLALRARHQHPATATIVIGDANSSFDREARQCDASYIERPFTRDDVTATARALMHGASNRAEMPWN